MKKSVLYVFGLVFFSLACKTLIPSTPPAKETAITAQAAFPTSTSTPEIVEVIPTHILLPTPEPINCTDASCVDACLARINSLLDQSEYEPLTGIYGDDNIDLNLVYYKVADGELGKPQFLFVPDEFKVYQEDTAMHQNVWAYASGLLPPEKRYWLSGFEIFSSSYYAAWVRPGGRDHTDRAHWELGMDVADAQDPIVLTYILVHEFGHVITLNTDQIPSSDYYFSWNQNPAVCNEFLTPDGCSLPDSYINRFYQNFWKDIFDEWRETVEKPIIHHPDEFYELVNQFYVKHPDQFVREYASTNIKEDLAESFMYFVMEPKPTGSDIVSQKILFFYDFPEAVLIRQQMIQNICSYTQ